MAEYAMWRSRDRGGRVARKRVICGGNTKPRENVTRLEDLPADFGQRGASRKGIAPARVRGYLLSYCRAQFDGGNLVAAARMWFVGGTGRAERSAAIAPECA